MAGLHFHSFNQAISYFYSASSSLLLFRDALDTATVPEFRAEAAPQATVIEGLAQGPYVAA